MTNEVSREASLVLDLLQQTAPTGLSPEELVTTMGIDTHGAYQCVAELIAAGHPITIEYCERYWVRFGESEAVSFTYSTSIDDLDRTAELIRNHMQDLRQMLCGLEEAKRSPLLQN